MKHCASCLRLLPNKAFARDNSKKDNLQSWCHKCTSESAKKTRNQKQFIEPTTAFQDSLLIGLPKMHPARVEDELQADIIKYIGGLGVGRVTDELKIPPSKKRVDVAVFSYGSSTPAKPDVIIEVKLGKHKMRGALGQILEYRTRLGGCERSVIATQGEVDPEFVTTCANVNVELWQA